MDLFAASKVWTYWISWFIVIPVVLLIVGVAVLYLVKVVNLKHPKQ
jgi:amino acid permease